MIEGNCLGEFDFDFTGISADDRFGGQMRLRRRIDLISDPCDLDVRLDRSLEQIAPAGVQRRLAHPRQSCLELTADRPQSRMPRGSGSDVKCQMSHVECQTYLTN